MSPSHRRGDGTPPPGPLPEAERGRQTVLLPPPRFGEGGRGGEVPYKLIGLLTLFLAAAPATAHDYWIEPATFSPAAGKPVAVRVYVGDHFKSEGERPFQKKPTVRFRLVSAKETADLARTGREGRTPMGEAVCPRPGCHWIDLRRGAVPIKLEADKFNRYLAAEGLDAVREQRRRAGEDRQPGRERYSRCLKCLLRVGAGDDAWKRVLGQQLEIVPLADPASVKPGGTLRVRVQFEGKPLAKAAVFALRKDGGKVTTQRLRTDAEGTAAVVLAGKGVWLVRLVHMRRCTGNADADWESVWAALTFEVK